MKKIIKIKLLTSSKNKLGATVCISDSNEEAGNKVMGEINNAGITLFKPLLELSQRNLIM